jgi:tetratricopeptide (TPR) repeat protein
LENLRISIENLQIMDDSKEKHNSIHQLVESAIKTSDEIATSGDYYDAGEFLYSAGELLEELDLSHALKIYKQNIKLWEKLISDLIIQAQLHEIAEIYLRIADIYGEKLNDVKARDKNILKSISYLMQEINLITDFSDTGNSDIRKLAQNYQNVAELYLKVSDFKNAISIYESVINLAKLYSYFDILSFSYQQIASCYEELDDYNKSKDIILDAIDYFSDLFEKYDEKNKYAAIAEVSQILKNLYKLLDDEEQFSNYSKKEAGAYINLAKNLEKNEEQFQKIARYYRGAGLCYQEINNNLIECASCFILAGNYSEKVEDYSGAAINFTDAANVFKDLNNFDMSYKHFIKAGDNFWKINDLNQSTESYLNAFDIAFEGNLEFNRFGLFNQIVRGLNKIAKEGLKNKQFFTAATLILESIKFYEQLDIAKDIFLREMVRNVYKYYYKAANLKKIGYSHVVHSYVIASLSSILNGKVKKAWEIMSEIDSEGRTVSGYKELIKTVIEWVSEGKKVEYGSFPFRLQRIIEGSEEIMYIISLFKSLQPRVNMLS